MSENIKKNFLWFQGAIMSPNKAPIRKDSFQMKRMINKGWLWHENKKYMLNIPGNWISELLCQIEKMSQNLE